MKKKNNRKRGFSLVELLATIIVISIAFGIGYVAVTGIIKTSKDKSLSLTDANIRSAARIYIKEYPEEIYWDNNKTCVTVETLIEKGYLKRKQAGSFDNLSISITKNQNGTIESDEFDLRNNVCADFEAESSELKGIDSSAFCNNLTYEPETERSVDELCKREEGEDCPFDIEVTYNNEKVTLINNAGIYTVIAKDSNNKEKTFKCRVAKATPQLVVNPPAASSKTIGSTSYAVISSDVVGKISSKVSNKSYISSKTIDLKDVPEELKTSIEEEQSTLIPRLGLKTNILAGRNASSYVTITLEPTDNINYKSTTTKYMISETGKVSVEVPTEEYCRTDVIYSDKEQVLVEMPKDIVGFTFADYTGPGNKKHEITAKLKYGYIWKNGGEGIADTNNNYILTCDFSEPAKPKAIITCANKNYNGAKQTIASCSGGTISNHQQTNAGNYPITCTGDSVHSDATTKTCSINKIKAVITCANKYYNGAKQTIASCAGGTIYNHQQTNIGNYQITCAGDTNHTNADNKTCSIVKPKAVITCANKLYNGSKQTIASCSGGTISNHQQTNVGNYTIKCTGDANHNNADNKTCVISKSDASITFSPNGGSYTSPKKVTISCKATSGVKSFDAWDDKKDHGTKNSASKRTITLSTTGSRTITATCTSKNGGKTTASKKFKISAASSGGGGGGGGGGSSSGSKCKCYKCNTLAGSGCAVVSSCSGYKYCSCTYGC